MSNAIAKKVAHVTSARQTRNHRCHWPECPKQVAPALWGCSRHWYALPHYLRAKVWVAYRINQEETGRPSAQYVAVAREVQNWIAENIKRSIR
jgi:CDP-diacylglycerol pyrophosphatase